MQSPKAAFIPSQSSNTPHASLKTRTSSKTLLQGMSSSMDDLPRKTAGLSLNDYSTRGSSDGGFGERGNGKKTWWQSLLGKKGLQGPVKSQSKNSEYSAVTDGGDTRQIGSSNTHANSVCVGNGAVKSKTPSSTTLVPEGNNYDKPKQVLSTRKSVYGPSYVPKGAVESNTRASDTLPRSTLPKKTQQKKLPTAPKTPTSAPPSAPPTGIQEDTERNSRHGEVVALLSGRKRLSNHFSSRYKLGEVLGDGAFGFVLTARCLKGGDEVAVKFIIKSKIPKELWNSNAQLPVEINILGRLEHPNIIRYIEHIHEQDYILLITELHGTEWSIDNPLISNKVGLRASPRAKTAQSPEANMECSPLFRLTEEQERAIKRRTSCDLFECIDAHKSIPEDVCKKIIVQIALAVKYMNDHGIVHRDLKDENVVIDENYNVKIVDFGSASMIPDRKDRFFTKFNGTAHFASPEIAKGNAYRGPEAEVWTLGVLLFTLVSGENPFQNRQEIVKGDYEFPCKVNMDCRHLISKMLSYHEKSRITIDGVLGHRWLKDEVARLRKEYAARGVILNV